MAVKSTNATLSFELRIFLSTEYFLNTQTLNHWIIDPAKDTCYIIRMAAIFIFLVVLGHKKYFSVLLLFLFMLKREITMAWIWMVPFFITYALYLIC